MQPKHAPRGNRGGCSLANFSLWLYGLNLFVVLCSTVLFLSFTLCMWCIAARVRNSVTFPAFYINMCIRATRFTTHGLQSSTPSWLLLPFLFKSCLLMDDQRIQLANRIEVSLQTAKGIMTVLTKPITLWQEHILFAT